MYDGRFPGYYIGVDKNGEWVSLKEKGSIHFPHTECTPWSAENQHDVSHYNSWECDLVRRARHLQYYIADGAGKPWATTDPNFMARYIFMRELDPGEAYWEYGHS